MTTKVKTEVTKSMTDVIEDSLSKLQAGEAKRAAAIDPQLPVRQREEHKELLQEPVAFLEGILSRMKPLIYNLRPRIAHITEHTEICAIYLLFGSVISKWETILLLLKQGRSYEAMDLARSLQEALDLTELFISDPSNKHLKEWFGGKTVSNRTARKVFERILQHTPFDGTSGDFE